MVPGRRQGWGHSGGDSYRWRWPDGGAGADAGDSAAVALAELVAAPVALGQVLARRGVGRRELERLMQPRLADATEQLGRVPGIEAAAGAVLGHAQRGRVGLLCDYDVDGGTASAVLTWALRAVGVEPLVVVPDRDEEGFGPQPRCLEELVQAGASCVVTLDCGTQAVDLLNEYRARHGLYPVVIDHHPGEEGSLDEGVLVNPWLDGGGEASRNLCAAALAWFLARSVLRQAGLDARSTLRLRRGLTALATLGTVCDVMSLRDPWNRAVVEAGTRYMREGPVGLRELVELSGIKGPVDAGHCGWQIGPRINAGSRMGNSALAAACLRERDGSRARALAALLDSLNRRRRAAQKRCEEALPGNPGGVSVVVAEDGNPGIAGLLAGTMVRRFGWPSVVVAPRRDGLLVGSGRSSCGLDLGAAVRDARREGIVQEGGGHAAACGLTVARDRVADLEGFLGGRLPADAAPELVIDAELDSAALSGLEALARAERSLEPWGQGFERPMYGVRRVVLEDARETARGHAMLRWRSGDVRFAGVWWSPPPDWEDRVRSGPCSLAGEAELNEWRGRVEGRLVIRNALPLEQAAAWAA